MLHFGPALERFLVVSFLLGDVINALPLCSSGNLPMSLGADKLHVAEPLLFGKFDVQLVTFRSLGDLLLLPCDECYVPGLRVVGFGRVVDGGDPSA